MAVLVDLVGIEKQSVFRKDSAIGKDIAAFNTGREEKLEMYKKLIKEINGSVDHSTVSSIESGVYKVFEREYAQKYNEIIKKYGFISDEMYKFITTVPKLDVFNSLSLGDKVSLSTTSLLKSPKAKLDAIKRLVSNLNMVIVPYEWSIFHYSESACMTSVFEKYLTPLDLQKYNTSAYYVKCGFNKLVDATYKNGCNMWVAGPANIISISNMVEDTVNRSIYSSPGNAIALQSLGMITPMMRQFKTQISSLHEIVQSHEKMIRNMDKRMSSYDDAIKELQKQQKEAQVAAQQYKENIIAQQMQFDAMKTSFSLDMDSYYEDPLFFAIHGGVVDLNSVKTDATVSVLACVGSDIPESLIKSAGIPLPTDTYQDKLVKHLCSCS